MKKLILSALLLLATTSLYAGDNFVEVGTDAVFYDNTSLGTDGALNARWGTLGDTGLYAWGSYEQPDIESNGSNVSTVEAWGIGGGLRVPFDNSVYAFAEVGYYFVDNDRSVDYDGDLGGSFGVGYDITDHFTANVKYRFLKIDAKIPSTVYSVDMSAIAVGLSYRF